VELGSAPVNGRALNSADPKAAVRAAIYAGLIAAFLSFVPLGPGFLLSFPLAGFLCVMFYRRWTTAPEPGTGSAFKLGTLAGVFGFVGMLVLTALKTVASSGQNELRNALIEAVRQQQAHTGDPQARQMLDYFTSPQGMALMIIFGFIFMGIVLVLLSGLGAIISASLLRRKSPHK
jgi:ABC-type antimicrobial peptide transport system permease subunit